jgi:hypothetical protein
MNSELYLVLILLVFQISGLCVVPNTTFKSVRPIVLNTISALFITLSVAILVCSIFYEINIFHQASAIGKFSDIIQFVFPVGAHLLALIETILRRKHHQNLFKCWTSMDRLCKQINIDLTVADSEFIRNYALKFAVLNFVSLASELRIIYGIFHTEAWFTSWCLKLSPFAFGRISDSQLIFFVDLVKNRNKYLNVELQEISIKKNQRSFSCKTLRPNRNNQKQVAIMKELRNEMFVTLKYINKRFGNSVLATVISNFICLTVALFFVVTKFVYAGKIFLLGETRKKYTFIMFFNQFFSFLESCLHVIPPVLSFFFVFNSVEGFIQEARIAR